MASVHWAGNEDEMQFCIHKWSVTLIRNDVHRIQTNSVHSACLVKQIVIQL